MPFVLACGMCADAALAGILPFLVYWSVCLLLWALVIGPVCLSRARQACPLAAGSPAWFLLGLALVILASAPLTGGAVILPTVLLLPFWGIAIYRATKQQNPIWRRCNKTLAVVLVSCIPVSYAVPCRPFSEYRDSMNGHHSPRIAATRADLKVLSLCLADYVAWHGDLPSETQGLSALVTNYPPSILPQDALADAWGRPVAYRVDDGKPTLTSAGPDGELGTLDDLTVQPPGYPIDHTRKKSTSGRRP